MVHNSKVITQFLLATHIQIIPAFTPKPHSITALRLVFAVPTHWVMARLSWPGRLVIYWDFPTPEVEPRTVTHSSTEPSQQLVVVSSQQLFQTEQTWQIARANVQCCPSALTQAHSRSFSSRRWLTIAYQTLPQIGVALGRPQRVLASDRLSPAWHPKHRDQLDSNMDCLAPEISNDALL